MADRRDRSSSPRVLRSRPEHCQEQPPVRLHRASDVAEGGDRVGEEHHSKPGEAKIEGLCLKGVCRGVVQHKLHVVGAGSRNALASKSQLLFG